LKNPEKMTPGFTIIRDSTPTTAIPKGAVVAMAISMAFISATAR